MKTITLTPKAFKLTKSELVAKKVLEECGLDDPTEMLLSDIILGRNAYYEELPLKGKDGEIISLKGKSMITVNNDITYESRKRFAAAHELGHHEMHQGIKPIFSDTEYDLANWFKAGPHEMEANEFASEFLMPSAIFYKECEKKKFSAYLP